MLFDLFTFDLVANIEARQFRIGLCSVSDLFPLAECARHIWVRYYPQIIGMPQVIYMLNRMYQIKTLLQRMEAGHTFLKVLLPGGCMCGFAELETPNSGMAFLHKFYIRLHLRGSGLAEQLMKAVEKEALNRGAHSLQLNVNRKNIPAIRFYERRGFSVIQSLDVDIGGGFYMNDYRMGKPLEVKSEGIVSET